MSAIASEKPGQLKGPLLETWPNTARTSKARREGVLRQLTKVDDARVGATLTHVDQLALDAVSIRDSMAFSADLTENHPTDPGE